jgi:hypothetical protein
MKEFLTDLYLDFMDLPPKYKFAVTVGFVAVVFVLGLIGKTAYEVNG